MKDVGRMWRIFSEKEKLKLFILLILTAIGALLELLGVSAITPFVNVAMNPDSISDNAILLWLYTTLNIKTTNEFLTVLAITLVIVYIVKNMFLILLYNFQYKFTYNSQQRLEGELLSCYMKQDYSFHLSHNSAELQRNILQDITGFFASVLAYLQMLTEGFVCITLFIFLFFQDKTITVGITVLLGIFVLLFQGLFKKKTTNIGVESRAASAKRVQWVQQSLDGIKEIKILGREHHFLSSYNKNAAIYAERQRKYQLTMIVPRPIMETLCIGSLMSIVAIKLSSGVNIAHLIPTLSVFIVAAFRLLPSFSRVAGYIGTIAFQKSAVERVSDDIKEAVELQNLHQERELRKEKLNFVNQIHIKNISFMYPNTERYVLNGANVLIPKNTSVAFIGPSGAGKTTLADILLGILEPQKGEILIDNVNIYRHLSAWNEKIGYIPQTIYLMDDTIRNNIAFGIPEDEIENQNVKRALKEAQLLEYTEGLEEGLDTYIGERGIRLSGGQRQRIGIARALYTNPEVLILDEATSALDNETEKAIMEAIDMLQGNKTLIIIAHRLTTIQNCDAVYEIKNGKATLKDKKGI